MASTHARTDAGGRDTRGAIDGLSDRSTVRSSDRVLALLAAIVEGLGEDGGGRTLTELADRLDLAASTVSRQLASLEAAALVVRDDNDYLAGPALVRLAHRVVGRHPLPRLARPVLAEVAAATGETCVLAVPHGDRALYVAAADGTHTLRVTGWLGRDVPRTGSAVGRALAGEVTVGTAAVGRDTVEDGVTGVSAGIRDTTGAVVAAISLLGPGVRLEGRALDLAVTAVATAAGRLEALLGA